MSVIVVTRFAAKATVLEELARGEHGATLESIAAEAKTKGAIRHAFAEDTDGNLMVVDEWETEEAYHAFFAQQQDIGRVAAAAGVTAPPTATAYRVLDTPDRF